MRMRRGLFSSAGVPSSGLPKPRHHFALPPAVTESSRCAMSPFGFGVVRVLGFGRSDRCVPDDRGCGASSHVLLSHLCVFVVW